MLGSLTFLAKLSATNAAVAFCRDRDYAIVIWMGQLTKFHLDAPKWKPFAVFVFDVAAATNAVVLKANRLDGHDRKIDCINERSSVDC